MVVGVLVVVVVVVSRICRLLVGLAAWAVQVASVVGPLAVAVVAVGLVLRQVWLSL